MPNGTGMEHATNADVYCRVSVYYGPTARPEADFVICAGSESMAERIVKMAYPKAIEIIVKKIYG